MAAPKLKDPGDGKNLIPKREIERYRELINKRLKDDPAAAKRAAQIIEEMLKDIAKKK